MSDVSLCSQRCYNISAAIAAARAPKYVNKTAVCLASIFPTCSLHCLGVSIHNTTVNNSLFPASFLPSELLALNVTAGFDPYASEGYECAIESCVDGQPCNSTELQIGERVVVDEESGNRTIVPILQNVTSVSIDGCRANRASACLETCSEVGYLVCVPETDPFDLCVASCVANLTYIEAPYVFDQQLAVCRKKLRLTPSRSQRRGAAWYRKKQQVRQGFRTSFAFKMEHQSPLCATVSHPSHELKPENDMHCQGRGGDGFAFVVQDAGQTMYDADCALNVVTMCIDAEAQVCSDLCRTLCPHRVEAEQEECAASCLRASPYLLPVVAALDTAGGLLAQAAEAAANDCSTEMGECVDACKATPEQLRTGAAMADGGCLRTCLDAGARAYCEARCPLVDEDVDLECIQACALARSERASECFSGCNASCVSQAALELVSCGLSCDEPAALMPNGETVTRCRQSARAHSPHDSAMCLTSCVHDDETCLRDCAERPPEHLANCVGSCPLNNTLCVTQCLEGRVRLGQDCIMPHLRSTCDHTSVALGGGSSAVGFGSLRNALAVKFDTWYNSELSDPWLSHVAVHSGGTWSGAPSKSTQALALSYDMPDLNDAKYHEVVIEYRPEFEDALSQTDSYGAGNGDEHTQTGNDSGKKSAAVPLSISPAIAARMNSAQRGNLGYIGILRVALDGKDILRVPINLEELLTLDNGQAYVGFTGATGEAYQEHSIARWAFNESVAGVQLRPANLHCRHRVPSLWHVAEYGGSPLLPSHQALACTTGFVDPATPAGSMHSLNCSEDLQTDAVYCKDPNMRNVPPVVHSPLPDVSAHVGIEYSYVLPIDTFLDRQSDGRYSSELLALSISHSTSFDLSWLRFNASERRLHGVPTRPGTWSILVTATDPGFREGADPPLSVSDDFLLHVRDASVSADADYWTMLAVAGCRCFAHEANDELHCEVGRVTDPHACERDRRCHWGPLERIECMALLGPPPPPPKLEAGVHVLAGRSFHVHLPTSHPLAPPAPWPVLIVLHAGGGTGVAALDEWVSACARCEETVRTHVLIAPDGPQYSWNVHAEASTADDVGYVGTVLVNHLATFENVTPVFKVYGASNGAALVHRILIENGDVRITQLVVDSQPLDSMQHQGGHLHVGGPTNSYTSIKSAFTRRTYLGVFGGADGSIPIAGGESSLPASRVDPAALLTYESWETTAHSIGIAFGHVGSQIEPLPDNSTMARVSYADGGVLAYNFKRLGHGLLAEDAPAMVIVDFLAATQQK